MADIQHRLAPLGQRHPVHDWEVANATARSALTVTDADVGRIAKQNDTAPPTFFLLARVTGGVAWLELGAAGMSAGQQQALNDAVSAISALRGPVYIVQTLSGELANERTLEVAGALTIDWSQAGKVVLSAPAAAAAAPVGAQYIVSSADATLTAERVLSGAQGITVDFATAGQAIIKGPTGGVAPANAIYLVQSTDTVLTNERVVTGADGITVDYGTAGQAIFKATGLKAATYIVQTATAELDNERVLSGASGIDVDFATAGQAIVKPNATLRVPAVRWSGATATEIPNVVIDRLYTLTGTPTLTAADVGSLAMDAGGSAYLFTGFQQDVQDEAP